MCGTKLLENQRPWHATGSRTRIIWSDNMSLLIDDVSQVTMIGNR